jgi:hypothetical protein
MRITLNINCGKDSCAKERGVFCQFLVSRMGGSDPRRYLFDELLYDSDGGITGWLLRCEECKEAEVVK